MWFVYSYIDFYIKIISQQIAFVCVIHNLVPDAVFMLDIHFSSDYWMLFLCQISISFLRWPGTGSADN